MAKNGVAQKTSGGGGHHKSSGRNDKKAAANSKDSTHQPSSNQTTASASAANAQKAHVDSKLLTPEQRRLASLMNDKIDVGDIEKKVNKIMELTGATKDKAVVALHDCANELDKAIDMILEGDSLNEAEWKTQARQKKPKVTANKENEVSGGRHVNGGESRRGDRKERGPRGERSERGERGERGQRPPKEGGREGGRARGPRSDRDRDSKRDRDPRSGRNQSPSATDNQATSTAAAGDLKESWGEEEVQPLGRSNNSESNSSSRNAKFSSSRNSYAGKTRDGQRTNSSRTYQNKNFKDSSGFPDSIDTWTNSTVDQQPSQMTVGNWSDVADNDDDDYETSKTLETKVFTASSKQEDLPTPRPNLAAIVSGAHKKPNLAAIVRGIPPEPPKPAIVEQASQQSAQTTRIQSTATTSDQPELSLSSSAPTPVTVLNSSQASASSITQETQLSQPQPVPSQNQPAKIDLNTLLKSQQHATSQHPPAQATSTNQPLNALLSQASLASVTSSATQARNQQNAAGTALLQQLTQQATQSQQQQSSYRPLHYSKQASENIKSLVGIPSSSSAASAYVSGPATSTGAGQLQQPSAQTQLLEQPNAQRSQHARIAGQRMPSNRQRSKRIPESAVEMPNSDPISSLNVQFGALDCSTDSYLGDQSSTGPTFGDLAPPSVVPTTKPPPQLSATSQVPQQHPHQPVSHSQQQAGHHHHHQQTNLNQMLNQVQQTDAHASSHAAASYAKTAPPELGQMASSLVSSHHQQLSDAVLERVKQSSGSQQASSNQHSSATSHHYSQQKPGSLYQPQQHDSNASSQMYKSYGGTDTSSGHYGYTPNQSNYSNYSQQGSSGTSQQSAYGSGMSSSNVGYSSYGSSTTQQTSSAAGVSASQQANGASAHQKINLKDLETAQNQQSNTGNPSTNLAGLVSSSTVTTNVLKNTLTATGKTGGLPSNVPGVNTLLGTPQYMLQAPGLTGFYPIAYDMPMAGREHNFAPYPPQPGAGSGPDAKYASRSDAPESSSVQSSQAPVTQPAGHQFFGQFPGPPYGYFLTGVNMMPPSLYQTATPFLQVQPPNPAAASAGPPHNSGTGGAMSGGFSKGQSQPSYGSAFSNYNLQMQNQMHSSSDYVNKGYGSTAPGTGTGGDVQSQSQAQQQNQSTGSKQNTGSSVSDLNTNMYKSHAQLTKNYEKSNFQTGTPPPFMATAAAQAQASALGSYSNQYSHMPILQSNPSILHHSLQSDGSGSSSGNQRSLSQSQKNPSNKYYNWA